jgi:GNAT superfamily N-acetyltransferase
VGAAGAGSLDVRPASADRWDDVLAVFGQRGDQVHCWCQWFRLGSADFRAATDADLRAALQAQVQDRGQAPDAADPGWAPGVLATRYGEPVGWCAVAPRPGYTRLRTGRALRTAGVADDLADEGIWSVTCFVVRPDARRSGVSAALLAGAVDWARAQGAQRLEAYPVDLAARPKVSSAELFHGALSTFLAAGFRQVGRSSAARPVVRLEL